MEEQVKSALDLVRRSSRRTEAMSSCLDAGRRGPVR